jgi:pyruvate/2-oxoglutarate dehydrogenase complex dihydrolipoamide dehydrogenase (E3) component
VLDGGEFGVSVSGSVSVDFAKILQRMRRLRTTIAHDDSVQRLTQLGVDVFLGEARFVSKSAITVNDQVLKFAKACVASGYARAVMRIR